MRIPILIIVILPAAGQNVHLAFSGLEPATKVLVTKIDPLIDAETIQYISTGE